MSKDKSVLVDTSFLISLCDNSSKRPNHETAKKYLKYFLNNRIKMHLSVIVISEFHQGQSITEFITSGNYSVLPFNYEDALEAAQIAFNLNKVNRITGSRAEFSDDIKLIGQVKNKQIDFLITDDVKTLYKYCDTLNKAKMLNCKAIALKDGFDVSLINGGQTSLLIDGDLI